jgi:DNA-binding NtrC family response regulator
MKNVVLCSSNPILVKSLYGILRDEGHTVETTEHPAFAVQKIIEKKYDCVIIDSEPFGLSAEDAADIIRKLSPGIQVLFIDRVGCDESGEGREKPLDLEEFRNTFHRSVA